MAQKNNEKNYYFSVIMTIYNIEQYLEEAILSVINQTLSFKDYIEIILVNDGSPDNSDIICKKYAEKYPNNIVYIEKENGGVSSARNAGLEIASGKIINFLDSDDYFSKNAFEEVKNFFEENNNQTEVVAINLINFENSSGSWVNQEYFKKTQIIDMNKDYHFMQCQVGASFIKRESALKYKYDEKIKIHEDSHYLYRIFRDNPFCGVISNATYWHRIRSNGTSATQTIKHKNNIFNMSGYLLKDLINFYKEKNNELPSFFQTFIILEFNYYVLEKINEIKLNKEEKEELKIDIKNIIDNLSIKDINEHPFVNNNIKERYIKLKDNIDLLYSKKLYKNTLTFKEILKKVYRKIKRIFGKIRMPFSRSIKKVIELEEKLAYQQIEMQNQHNLIDQLNTKIIELEQTEEVLKEKSLKINEIQELEKEILELKKETNYNLEDIKYLIYFHGGSRNRGCEALLKTIIKLINKTREECSLITFRKEEDLESNINRLIKYILEPKLKNKEEKIEYMGNVQFNFDDLGIEEYLKQIKNKKIAFSIGGDNYCYGEYVNSLLYQYNYIMHQNGIKTALLGCSIESDILKDNDLLKDLNMYDLIIARESITYNALLEAGINKNTVLIPDTAFLLNSIELDLPENFIEGKTIGINMSPLIQEFDKQKVYDNYYNLIKHIIEKTNYNIALIPHVFWENSNDYEAMLPLYKEFEYTKRITLIEEHNSEELKGYIKKCKMFIGTRTHTTIAAYSSCIPTLTVGYSVKSKGIAKDIFGTDKNYVIAVQDLQEKDDLIKSFEYIEKNYEEIKKHLEKFIPKYIEPLKDYSKCIQDLEDKKTFAPLPKKQCTGCTACANICPTNCIKMQTNKEGFKYPKIDYQKCIKCQKCQIICPINNNINNNYEPLVYAAKSKDETRLNSSSGGIFPLIAKEVIEKKGIVYGAAFNENLELKHIKITKTEEINKLQGSKYLQSDLEETFKEIKTLLEKKETVLFSGTPCQIKGLKQYLDIEYENLYTIDVICHGVPSPKVFEKYKNELEEKYNSKITKFSFRNKNNGWKKYNVEIIFENKTTICEPFDENIYMKGFLRNLYLRECCYECSSNNFTSKSDITLGDYWGLNDIHPIFDDDKGTNLLIINSEKGKRLVELIKEKIEIIETDLSKAIKYNEAIYKQPFKNKNREEFFKNLDNEKITKNIEENLYDK